MEDHMNRMKVYNKKEKITGWMPGIPREVSEKLATDLRKTNNKEVNFGFTAVEAQAEAERCMRCYYLGMVAV
jgi:formate dehydrogenase beta subunit